MAIAESSRRRSSASPTKEEDDYALPKDYKAYVPVAKRRAQMMSNLGRQPKKAKILEEVEKEDVVDRTAEDDEEEEKAREDLRQGQTLFQAAQEVKERKAMEGECFGPVIEGMRRS